MNAFKTVMNWVDSLTPHGVSGLKSYNNKRVWCVLMSHPTRGEWIEMPSRVVFVQANKSHPTRGEWIEILYSNFHTPIKLVSPHTG